MAACTAALGVTVFSSSFLVLAGFGFVDKKKQPIYSAVFFIPFTREFRAFTREFRPFTRGFLAFTREFRPFTRDFQFKLLSC
ncbi:hypothetical protein QNH26_20185 [Peribacillus frigoritolerans]|uniref:hypothetical protein n=1 Tax=Peribacillus frigoritolerans TaxID=450367 RepID=UPI0024C14F70|nr:hypothetical protein [Peribacillus frigoritolerans]WHX65968.1 hypothetical protein QNH26_20185 [Peribacillus frigoritolerans]